MSYNALMLALRKSEVNSFGSTATFLLEAFLEDSGRISASKVVARGLCNEGEFSNWRKHLVDKGWLIWSETQSDKGQYYPGKKLIKYVNKEKMNSREIVTKDEVLSKEEAATKEELRDIKARMSRIEEVVQELQDAVIPPDTEEKRLARERAAARLGQLAKAN